MKARKNIDWATKTVNPVHGCEGVHGRGPCQWPAPGSGEIVTCYAAEIDRRFGRNFSSVRIQPHKLDECERYRTPQIVFVGSACDLFGTGVNDEVIGSVLDRLTPLTQHKFLFLTKAPERYADFTPFPDHFWMGTTIDNLVSADDRICAMHNIRAGVRWVSHEPLVYDLADSFDSYEGIGWVVLGALSRGSKKYQPKWGWTQRLVVRAWSLSIPVFMKENLHYEPHVQQWPRGFDPDEFLAPKGEE